MSTTIVNGTSAPRNTLLTKCVPTSRQSSDSYFSQERSEGEAKWLKKATEDEKMREEERGNRSKNKEEDGKEKQME